MPDRSAPSPDRRSRDAPRHRPQRSPGRGSTPARVDLRAPASLHPDLTEHRQPVPQQPRRQEAPPDRLLAGPPEALPEAGVGEDLERTLSALLGAAYEEPRLAVGDLQRDAAHIAADERSRLPDRLAH